MFAGVPVRELMDVSCERGFVTLVRDHRMVETVVQLAHKPCLDLAICCAAVIHAAKIQITVQRDNLFIAALINTLKD